MDFLDGAQVEQVDEHHNLPFTHFIFEYECYPEAKILNSNELRSLYVKYKNCVEVGKQIGASESFARQNMHKSHDFNR